MRLSFTRKGHKTDLPIMKIGASGVPLHFYIGPAIALCGENVNLPVRGDTEGGWQEEAEVNWLQHFHPPVLGLEGNLP
jgi:hypothetical protein